MASVPTVIAAMIRPQINLTRTAGFRLPFDVIMLMTKVPESALVTRKMKMRHTVRKFSTLVAGKYSKKANSAADTSANTFSARPPLPKSSM